MSDLKQEIRVRWISYALIMGAACTAVRAADEQRFATSDEAIHALTEAAKGKDTNALAEIFGPGAKELMSADPVQASNGLARFSQRVSDKVAPVVKSDSRIELNLGWDGWPFPIPLVKADGQWSYDTDAGKEEIVNRRIGRDELDTIRVCHAYVAAQREYAGTDRNGDGILQYAQMLRSTPGRHDGLYWHAEEGEETSPLGPLIAEARGEGYVSGSKIMATNQTPFEGYCFQILTQQGPDAPGGEYTDIINGHMIAGFGLVAWPAKWGNTGVMTFIVNQQGKVYQKNLGPDTDELARQMTVYDPDPSWKPAE